MNKLINQYEERTKELELKVPPSWDLTIRELLKEDKKPTLTEIAKFMGYDHANGMVVIGILIATDLLDKKEYNDFRENKTPLEQYEFVKSSIKPSKDCDTLVSKFLAQERKISLMEIAKECAMLDNLDVIEGATTGLQVVRILTMFDLILDEKGEEKIC